MAENSFVQLIQSADYQKITRLVRQLKDGGYACKLQQTGENKSKNIYEIQVKAQDYAKAQLFLFGEAYEPDYEGKYAKKEALQKKLRKQFTWSLLSFIVGLILNLADSGNGDLTLIALVAFGVGIWYLSLMYKSFRALLAVGKKKKTTNPN